MEVAPFVAIESQIRASAAHTALAKAGKLSGRQAYEVWRVMQLITTNQSSEGLPGPAVQAAMDFIPFPKAWKGWSRRKRSFISVFPVNKIVNRRIPANL